MTKQLSFKVSAKTARLIGRENVSTADAAVSELVKNSYDADARVCVIAFRKRYTTLPLSISESEYNELLAIVNDASQIYHKDGIRYNLVGDFNEESGGKINSDILRIRDLWILDNGAGMSSDAIEKNWMVIGTNFKEQNVLSAAGRTRTGAKGIGRFALDRLGETCKLSSKSLTSDGSDVTLTWRVDWRAFEDENAVLDQVKATLDEGTADFQSDVTELLSIKEISSVLQPRPKKSDEPIKEGEIESFKWDTGTCIRISGLRDAWAAEATSRLRRALSSLVPPDEQSSFKIVVYDDSSPSTDIEIFSEVLEDYDYKLEVEFSEEGVATYTIWRNELNVSEFPSELFLREEMKVFPFDKASFGKKSITYTKTLEQIFGPKNIKAISTAKILGPFSAVFRFYKLSLGSGDDQRKYPYRSFNPGPRKDWMDRFAGIKIYRDNFFVRPYGEVGSRAFDWLGLGQRRAANPVQPSRKSWPVSPQNISGTVKISRQANAALGDQSNREAIVESPEFEVFIDLLLRSIREFERDRSTILFNLLELFKELDEDELTRLKGEKIAEKLVREAAKESAQKGSKLQSLPLALPPTAQEEALTLSKTVKVQQAEIRDLREEQVMLRSLATLGTVLVSFSHEMGQLQNAMGTRAIEMAGILGDYISRETAALEQDAFNPYIMLDEWAEEDRKVKQWFSFALNSVRPERRRRKHIDIQAHINTLANYWKGFLLPREIELKLDLNVSPSPNVLAYEIDIDSIFNNLILNSIEAFTDSVLDTPRLITIESIVNVKGELQIDYTDNGPGLDLTIGKPNDIFEFAVTTKKDSSGNAIGTGLGMWILESIVRSNGGSADVRNPLGHGFGIEIRLPISRVDENEPSVH
ncbi:sensor histidine kinase [Asticcacaulis tiandongensis]|uniref:sensor histidine kinase n=1 Tax=Asticcacaulis tiandongensis TaxID=2565365 RepID=UPI001125D3E6|nr:sensor histidine kinase [Asticcacaulis tiandongensis]